MSEPFTIHFSHLELPCIGGSGLYQRPCRWYRWPGFSSGHVITNSLFDGSVKCGSGTTWAGAFLGWQDNASLNKITNCVENGSYSSVTHAGFCYVHAGGGNGSAWGNKDSSTNNWTYKTTHWDEVNDIGSMSTGELLGKLGSSGWVADNGKVVPKTNTITAITDYFFPIHNADDWKQFRNMVQVAGGKYDINARLYADISTGELISWESSYAYRGTFDGNGHTITFDLANTGQQFMAPFRYVGNATIKNLHTAGVLNTSVRYASGLIGWTMEGTTVNIENCRSSVTLKSTVNGEGLLAGIIGRLSASNVIIRNTKVDGSFEAENANCNRGFVAWVARGSNLVIDNCVFAPDRITTKIDDCHTWVKLDTEGVKYSLINSYAITEYRPIIVIRNAGDWHNFAVTVNNAQNKYWVDARLEADITISEHVGVTEGATYRGTFDGNGHTITFNKDGFTEKFIAPFRHAGDATIKVNIKGLSNGKYPITLKAVKLSETDISKFYEVSEVVTKLTVSSATEDTDVTDYNNIIYVAPAIVDPMDGTEIELSICMNNTADIRGFQFDMYLPDGMTAVKTPKGKVAASLNAARLPEDDEHTLTVAEQADDAIRFLCGSQYDETFTGTSGEIATIKVNIKNMADGEYPIILKDIKLSETDISKFYEVDDDVTTLTISTGATQAAADQAAADAVIAKIADIGEVAYTDESKALIDAAREAYDALTDTQKELVTNYNVLTDAETTYAELKAAADQAAAEQAANQAAANAVIAKIADIGEVAYTDESKALIDAAREAYDALTDTQKELVTNYNVLTDAEATYAELKTAADQAVAEQAANQAAANAVIAKIADIGDVAYTDESKVLIDAAREAYDALTDTQKELVTNYNVLTDAEATYAELKAATGINANPVNNAIKAKGWYDMNGHRLTGKPTVKGMYVKDGKKVLLTF